MVRNYKTLRIRGPSLMREYRDTGIRLNGEDEPIYVLDSASLRGMRVSLMLLEW